MVETGDTDTELPLPTKEPPQLPEYQFQDAPVPSEPPETDKVVAPPQVGLTDALAPVGSVDNAFTVTGKQVATLDPQILSAVTQIFPEVTPNVVVIVVVPCPPVMFAPAGAVHA